MPKNLHQQIEEDEAKLETTNDGDDDAERSRNDKSGETSRSGRSHASEEHEADDGSEGKSRKRGRDGELGRSGRRRGTEDASADGEGSQGGSETSHGDGEASHRTGKQSRGDGRPSRGDAGKSSGSGNDELNDDDEAEDPVAMARMRRENRELKAKLREREEKDASGANADGEDKTKQTTTKKDDPKVTDPEPDKAKNPDAWKDWKIRDQDRRLEVVEGTTTQTREQIEANETVRGAVEEFKAIRDRYIEKNPDFVPAFNHAFNEYCVALLKVNPSWTRDRVQKEVDWQILKYSGECARKKIDPAEAIYDMAIERFGYKPGSGMKRGTEDDGGEDEGQDDGRRGAEGMRRQNGKRPNLSVVKNNQRRSASPLHGGGQSGNIQLTREAVANMSLGELKDLSQEDWDRLERLG